MKCLQGHGLFVGLVGYLGVFLGFGFIGSPSLAQSRTETLEIEHPTRYSLGQYFEHSMYDEMFEYVLRYELIMGLHPKLDLKLSYPSILHRRVRQVLDESRGHDRNVDISGTGDVSIGIHGTVFRRSEPFRQRIAVIAEIMLPTGADDKKEFAVRLARRMQIGSGAFGFKGGIANTLERDRHRLATSLYYQHWTRHEQIRLGPSLHVDAGYSYRFLPVLNDPTASELQLRGVMQVASSYRWSSLDASGRWLKDEGPEVWIKPGFEIRPPSGMKIQAQVAVPVCQERQDDLGDRRWGATIAIQINF